MPHGPESSQSWLGIRITWICSVVCLGQISETGIIRDWIIIILHPLSVNYLVNMLLKGPIQESCTADVAKIQKLIFSQQTIHICLNTLVKLGLGIKMASVTICSRRKDGLYTRERFQTFNGTNLSLLRGLFASLFHRCICWMSVAWSTWTWRIRTHKSCFLAVRTLVTGISDCWFTIGCSSELSTGCYVHHQDYRIYILSTIYSHEFLLFNM